MRIDQMLKLAAVQKPNKTDPVLHRRERLINQLNKQSVLVQDYQKGIDAPGKWFWVDEGGTIFMPVKYGKTSLELGKGKYAIECDGLDDVLESIDKVKGLVRRGVLDEILKSTAERMRSKFTKK